PRATEPNQESHCFPLLLQSGNAKPERPGRSFAVRAALSPLISASLLRVLLLRVLRVLALAGAVLALLLPLEGIGHLLVLRCLVTRFLVQREHDPDAETQVFRRLTDQILGLLHVLVRNLNGASGPGVVALLHPGNERVVLDLALTTAFPLGKLGLSG